MHAEKVLSDKTKIIATIGPASSPPEVLKKMILSGVDVCRLNFSHGTHEDHLKVIETVRALNDELGTNVALLADLQGPKIRCGEIENNGVEIKDGQQIKITTTECVGNAECFYLSYKNFPQDVKPGEFVQIDDGKLLLKVVSSNNANEVIAEVVHGGILKSRKGINLPNTQISIPSITEKDMRDVTFAVEQKVDWIALSFVRSASDIIELRHVVDELANQSEDQPLLIAKIEKPEALDDCDNIIRETDAVMVARGDLGIEIPLEQVPMKQKMLAKKCNAAGKPIIIATQMMEGMIDNFNPTRAEVNDVANSVMDGADACMLSGETSIGKFPVDVIKTMQRIISEVEHFEDIYHKQGDSKRVEDERYVSDAIIHAAGEMAHSVSATAIVGMTHTGYLAFKLSSLRPKSNIYIFSQNRSILKKLSLVWGVRGFYYDKFISTDHTIEDLKYKLRKEGLLKEGDLLVNIAATPLKERGKTNMIKLSQV